MRNLKGTIAVAVLATLVGLAPAATSPADAQGRGGGAGRQTAQGQRAGAGDRQRIHMDDQQRDQQRDRLLACDGAADQARRQARSLARAERFSPSEAARQRDRLREHIMDLEGMHNQLIQGFTERQRDRLRDPIRALDQSRDRLHQRFEALNGELAGPNPDPQRFNRRAREVEQACGDWQKQLHRLRNTLGLPPGS